MATSKDQFMIDLEVSKDEQISTNIPDFKGRFLSGNFPNYIEWNEYLDNLRTNEILELGVVRITPLPRHISPNYTVLG